MERIAYVRSFVPRPRRGAWAGAYSYLCESLPDLAEVSTGPRAEVEDDPTCLQLVGVVTMWDSAHGKVLAVRKRCDAAAGSPEESAFALWVGGHVSSEDLGQRVNDITDLARRTVKREVFEELGLAVDVDSLEPQGLYNPDTLKSARHLALCFVADVDLSARPFGESVAGISSEEIETCSIVSVDELLGCEHRRLEEWGRLVLHNFLFGEKPTAR